MILPDRAREEWEEYPVISPESFDEVMHTAHVDTALRIVEDQVIQAGLVFDESRLRKTRVLVTWLSPNEWVDGSRYGNIAFCYSFKELRQKFGYAYWIETADYSPKAPRFLLSENEITNYPRYKPGEDQGPWRYSRSDGHERERRICLELMIRGNLSTNNVSTVKFLDHHPSHCSEYRRIGRSCRQTGYSAAKGGAYFMCGIAGRYLRLRGLRVDDDNLFAAWRRIRRTLGNLDTNSQVTSSRNRETFARSLLLAIYANKRPEVEGMATLFKSTEILIRTVRDVLSQEFSALEE